jgi:hypothetical protein
MVVMVIAGLAGAVGAIVAASQAFEAWEAAWRRDWDLALFHLAIVACPFVLLWAWS